MSKTKLTRNIIFDNINKYRFEFRHLFAIFIILILFQMVISFVHRASLGNFLVKTQDWYQQDSAERLANLTATSLELLLENTRPTKDNSEVLEKKTIEAFNIILSQQLLQHYVQDICILINSDSNTVAIDDGFTLYSYFFHSSKIMPEVQKRHQFAINLFEKIRNEIVDQEHIKTITEDKKTFHIFVPFVPRGEYIGAIYVKNTPDFSIITDQIITSFNESNIIYSVLILIAFFAMFFISSYTLRERNYTQQKLFKEQKKHLEEYINHQKEIIFTKRIYHAHHKVEKLMGFIKEDLKLLTSKNIDEIKKRVKKYTNFVARVIYDMKWFDPPIQTIRSPIFHTDLNEVIKFLVDNVFLRVSDKTNMVNFHLDLDENIPLVNINEYIVWEIFEPIIQNSLDHGGDSLTVSIISSYITETKHTKIIIKDNGNGIIPELLEHNEKGIKKIFQEKISTKTLNNKNSGYGCYLAYEISKQRCGWDLDVNNLDEGGCQFIFLISNQ